MGQLTLSDLRPDHWLPVAVKRRGFVIDRWEWLLPESEVPVFHHAFATNAVLKATQPGDPPTLVAKNIFADMEGAAAANAALRAAKRRADAKAAKLLAAKECPEDLISWGQAHGIPAFAELAWQAGFLAGMKIAMLEVADDVE